MMHREIIASEGLEMPHYHYQTSISYLDDDEDRAAAQLAFRNHSESGLQLRYREHDGGEDVGEYTLSASSGSGGREHHLMPFMPHDAAPFSHQAQNECSVAQAVDPLTLSTPFRPSFLPPISRPSSPGTVSQPRVFHTYPTFGFYPSTTFHDAHLGNSPVEHDVSLRPIHHTPEDNDLGRRLPHPSPFVQQLALSPHAFPPPILSDHRPSFTSFPNLFRHEPQMANLNVSDQIADPSSEETAHLEWEPTELVGPPIQSNDSTVVPTIEIEITKGFFMTEIPEASWTCYRRNYFSVSCWFHLNPTAAGQLLVLGGRQIQAFSVRLSAVQDGPGGKNVELIGYTPKRDQGKKLEMKNRKLSPSAPPNRVEVPQYSGQYNYGYQFGVPQHQYPGGSSVPILHLQETEDAPLGPESYPPGHNPAFPNVRLPYQQGPHMHHFERIQFKNATANNGKRRASQQYFHLLVELYADVRVVGAGQAEWRKVAYRMSDKLVVRGRSPSHYDRGERFEPHSGGNGGGNGRTTGRGSRGSGYGANRQSQSGAYNQQRYPTQNYQSFYTGSGNIGGFRQLDYDVKPIKHSPTTSSSSSDGSEYKESPPGDLSPHMHEAKIEEVHVVADRFGNHLGLETSPEALPTLPMWGADSQHSSEMHYSSSYGSDRCTHTPPSVKSETRSSQGMIPLALPLPPSHHRQLSQPIPDVEYMDERNDNQGYTSHGYYHDLDHPDFGF